MQRIEPSRSTVKVGAPSHSARQGAARSRLIWPEITGPFSLSAATDYHPTKIGSLIAQDQGDLKSR
jgi:hypothetical protein